MLTMQYGRVRWSGVVCVMIVGAWCVSDLMALRARAQGSEGPAVYTSAQAARGKALYAENCGSCHAPDLTGSPMAPPLGRGVFVNGRRSFKELFEYTQLFMPVFSPNGLSRQQTADILAFVLESAEFPAGGSELPTAPDAQEMISFTEAARR